MLPSHRPPQLQDMSGPTPCHLRLVVYGFDFGGGDFRGSHLATLARELEREITS